MWVVAKAQKDKSSRQEVLLKSPFGAHVSHLAYDVKFVPSKDFGEHANRDAALRALSDFIFPDCIGCDIQHIKRIMKSETTGKGIYRIIKS